MVLQSWQFKIRQTVISNLPGEREWQVLCLKVKKRPWTITMFVTLTLLIDVSLWQVIKCFFSLLPQPDGRVRYLSEKTFWQTACLVPTRKHLPSFVLIVRAGRWSDTSVHVGTIRWIQNLIVKWMIIVPTYTHCLPPDLPVKTNFWITHFCRRCVITRSC